MAFWDKLFGKKKNEGESYTADSADSLTEIEKKLCRDANLSAEDGLLLKSLTKRPIEVLKFEDAYSETEKPPAIGSVTTEKQARKIVLEKLDYFREQGKYIFLFDLANNGRMIGLTGETSDPYKLLELADTNGVNYDIETTDIVEQLKKWDEEFGITLIGAGFDFCECLIKNKDVDFNKLAQEIYAFCPDTVDQGTETVEALAEELKQTGSIFLWWD